MYSQNNEECFILAAFEGSPSGRFLEIGAFHPTRMSNSRALFERGWGGVMIEPSPAPFARLAEAYQSYARITLVQAAVILDSAATEVQMHVTDDLYSTTEAANYAKWKDYTNFTGEIKARTITLERIHRAYGEFDFVSLDTEGTSVDLLLQLLENPFSSPPKCICVEYDDRQQEAMAAALKHEYRCVYRSSENLVLVR